MSKRPILDYFESEESQPKLYSRALIAGFTIVFSVLFGAILYVHNLRAVGKWHLAIGVTAGAILYYGISYLMMPFFDDLLFLPTILFNSFAGLLLAGPLWKRQIGELAYKQKSPMYPLLLAILIALGWLYARNTSYGLI